MVSHLSKVKWRKVQESLVEYISNNVDPKLQELENEIVKTYCYRIKKRIRYNSQMAQESQPLLDKVADSIKFVPRKKDKPARIEIDRSQSTNLFYLEYGTGLEGKANPHPEANAVNWKYAINENRKPYKYFNVYKRPNYGKKNGWNFKLRDASRQFVTKDDIVPLYYKYKYQTRTMKKNGEEPITKYYKRLDRGWIHTSGIKPVRALYNTKREFRRFLGHYNETNIDNLRKKLLKMRNEKVEVTNG